MRPNSMSRQFRNRTKGARLLRMAERCAMLTTGLLIGALLTRARALGRNTRPAVLGALSPIAPPPSELPQADSTLEVPAHERSDANVPALGIVLVMLGIGAFIIHACLWSMVKSRGPVGIDAATRWQVISPTAPESQRDVPQLQLSPQRDLKSFLSSQKQQLDGTGPGEGTNGTSRTPIERAMALVAEHGAPKWRSSNQLPRALSPVQLQQGRATDPPPPSP